VKIILQRSYYMGNKFLERMQLYDELTPVGRLFVDGIAFEIERGFKARRTGTTAFGLAMARELALALLEHFWNGNDFPGKLSTEERVELIERMVV